MLDNINKLVNTNIALDKSSHVYSLHGSPEIKFSSVTKIVGDQFPFFDKELISKRLVKVSPKYQHLSWKELVKEWNEFRDLGTAVHEELESYINNGSIPTLSKAKIGKTWFEANIESFGDVLFSEVMVFSEELEVAGCVDLLVYNSAKNECFIFDWKTSKIIDHSGRKSAITSACFDLNDSRYDKYSLQLSIYSHLLEKYHGIPIKQMFMVHLTEHDADCIEAKNLNNNVNSIFHL